MRKFDQILKLPPELRVKALRLLSEELRKKIQESKSHIKDRESEIEELTQLFGRAQEELQVLEQIETPKPREINVGDLFRKEEKKEDKSLEEQLEHEKIQLTPQEEIKASVLSYRPTEELYSRFKELNAQKDELSQKERDEFYTLGGALEKQYEKAKQGEWHPEEKDWDRMTAAEKMIHYQRKQDYKR